VVILAGDVGGTKILLEVGEMRSGRWHSAFARRYPAEEVTQFEDVMHRFLGEWDSAKPKDAAPIRSGALGVAGPLDGNSIKMTNRPWAVDGDRIATRCGIPRFRVVNDLAASASGIDALGDGERVTLQPGEEKPGEPRVVIGVGTGLGVAYLIPGASGRPIVVPGESGHVGFAPETPEQAELWRALFTALGRVEVEDVVSGRGLANVHEFVVRREVGGHNKADPAWISENARSGRDAGCAAALELFAECLGNVAGNHALAVMARGGVFLAGGVVAKIADALHTPRLRQAFCAKGAFSSHLMRIPVHAVLAENLPVIGAARVASEE
jgi:glucokinase